MTKSKYFYDTCALIDCMESAFEEKFAISSITIDELENIKTSANKSPEVRAKARAIIRKIAENKDICDIVIVNKRNEYVCNDIGIIYDAVQYSEPFVFVTNDYGCYIRAIEKGLAAIYGKYDKTKEDKYFGFKEIYLTDEELSKFYQSKENDKELYNLLENEYLIIKDKNNKVLDKYKYKNSEFCPILYPTFVSNMFGNIKPKDIYQEIAMDSLLNNQMTLLRGPAGTGKSLLALGYLFSKLDKHEIDKIIIFCNTVATLGSAKLGFYPGSRDEKLLDAQIGNFLSSKIGSDIEVRRLIETEKILLLPMSDIRGFDTSGMNAGVYITEAQNLSIELMRLALQRIGEDCICILDGDDKAQVDLSLYEGNSNGLKRVSEVFRGKDFYGEVTLQEIRRSNMAKIAQLM